MRNTTKRPKKPATTPRKRPLQGMKKKNTNLTPIIDKTPVKVIKKQKKEDDKSNSIVNESEQSKQLQRIVKKRQYKAFMKLVKDGKYTSAMISARLLGVTRQTIMSWIATPKVQKIMNEEVDNYVSKIQSSKDWKAQAYLLDKLEGTKEEQETKQELKQLIVINT